MRNTINAMPVMAGDVIRYRTGDVSSQFGGVIPGKELVGKIIEVFPSIDGSYSCMWIEGQPKLITEHQVLEIISTEGGAAHGIV